ncbi:MAG TPA: site-specific integrase [Thermodesulfobacteriota bacterium]|nr:site-specific integrase [Thermodesulfobacteriota bacterium]
MTVYRRGKAGIFYMNFTYQGVRVFKTTGKTTKREARAVEASERHKLQKQVKQSPQERRAKTLLLDAINETYETKWKHGKDSQRSYRRACNVAEIIGNTPVGDIDEQVVMKMAKVLENRNNSTATVNRYKACLKTIMKQLKQPSDCIKLRKEAKGRLRIISKEEEVRILNLLRQDHGGKRVYYAEVADLIEVLLDTGMRLSEGLNLHYKDIDFQSNLISIWVNKGSKPRSIPMTKRVRTILESRRASNPEKPFTIKAHQAETAWGWLRKEMGLEGEKEFVIHSTRHTCASRMVNAGVDILVVQSVLGHASIVTTQIYAHLAPHKLAHAVSVLED